MIRRKIFLMAVLAALFVSTTACPKKPAKTPEPAAPPAYTPTSSAPSQDVPSAPSTGGLSDETEQAVPKSLQELQQEFEAQGLLGDVFFEYDKADLQDEAKSRLSRNAEFMKSRGEFAFTVEGHCDERGTNEYNLALGQRRAAAAADYIASLGVPASRLRTLSYGEERGFCTESNESCWQQNRRARFVITGRN